MNRRKFIQTLGLGAAALPVVAVLVSEKPKVIYTDGNIDHEPWKPIDNPGFETTSGRDAFKEWNNNNLRDEMRKESIDHYFDRLALKL